MEPKSVPGASKSDFKCVLIFGEDFMIDFHDFGAPKATPGGRQMDPRALENPALGAQGLPEAAWEASGSHFGSNLALRRAFWEAFWRHFGAILV